MYLLAIDVRRARCRACELIDILGWAMQNPSEPLVVDSGAVLEQSIEPVDMTQLPIPHHYREDAADTCPQAL